MRMPLNCVGGMKLRHAPPWHAASLRCGATRRRKAALAATMCAAIVSNDTSAMKLRNRPPRQQPRRYEKPLRLAHAFQRCTYLCRTRAPPTTQCARHPALTSPSRAMTLRAFLRVCLEPRAAAFLFDPGAADLLSLAAADLPHTAFRGDHTITRLRPDVVHPDPNCPGAAAAARSQSLAVRMLIAPFRAEPPLYFGIGVSNLIPTCSLPPLFTNAVLRVVFDATSCTLVSVVNLPKDDLLLLQVVQLGSPTTAATFSTHFRRSTFLHALATHPHSLEPMHILRAVSHFTVDSLTRACPFCDTPPPYSCRCSLPPLHKVSLRDVVHFFHGDFQGVSSIYPNPTDIVSCDSQHAQKPQSVFSRYNPDVPISFTEPLQQWALIRAVPPDPLLLPPPETKPHDPVHCRNEKFLLAEQSKNDPANSLRDDISRKLNELLELLAEGDPPKTLLITEPVSEHITLGEIPAPSKLSLCKPSCPADTTDYRQHTCSCGVCNPPARAFLQPPAEQKLHLSPTAGAGNSHSGNLRTTDEAPVARVEGVATIVRLIKGEERRVRNRLSAQRSNAKKRAIRLTLQRELDAQRARTCELVAAEHALRRENERLRGMLSRHRDAPP